MVVTAYVATGITATFGTLTGELVDVKQTGEKADAVDVTKQSSTNKWREFKAGLLDGGEWTLTMNHDPDAIFDTMGTAGTLLVTWPSGATRKFTASAIFVGRTASASLGQKMVADFTFKITAAPNWLYT